jgi:hypothetical protein
MNGTDYALCPWRSLVLATLSLALCSCQIKFTHIYLCATNLSAQNGKDVKGNKTAMTSSGEQLRIQSSKGLYFLQERLHGKQKHICRGSFQTPEGPLQIRKWGMSGLQEPRRNKGA